MKKRIVSILNLMGLMLAVAQYGEDAQAATTEVIRRTASGAVLLSRTTFDDGSSAGYTFDPDNQYEYSKLTYKYDSSGTLVSVERLYDDGAKQVSYFYAASSPLLMIHQNYVPSGSLLQQRVNYRNGDLYTSTYDMNGSQQWTAHHQMIRGQVNDGTTISGGTIDFNDYRMDDGTRRIERFDQLGNQTYTRFIDYLDKSGRVDYREMFMDNGNRLITDYDETNTLAWKSLYKTFNPKDQLLSQDYRFDDGTRQYEGFDVEGTMTWARYVSSYNAQSQLDYVTYYFKDGRWNSDLYRLRPNITKHLVRETTHVQ